ncbi:MAG: hypothetical protein MUC35_07390 [Candidatus Margulisbacteria bacterium]|jgi:hypothetical protein|nr:hypothetical protein [Candidatus Margulisiibacteriota bacterium]
MKKALLAIVLCSLTASLALAELSAADQLYLDQQTYQHNKLELTTKTRTISESRTDSNTDISSTTYRVGNRYSDYGYRDEYGRVNTSTVNRSQQIELTEWYVYKGGVQVLTDLEFLDLVGDRAMYDQVKEKNDGRKVWRRSGYASISLGLAAMIGGAAFSAGQPVIMGGAVVTTIGFFLTAFSAPPAHYIKSGYALNKIDEYNVALKKKLNLPLTYE